MRIHYAWVIAAISFLILIASAGVRATPSILMVPLEAEFGWTRAAISAAIAVNIALFGMIGPFAASLMNRFGIRRIVVSALLVLAVAVGVTSQMTRLWQFTLLWGVLVGSASGMTALVFAAIVTNRWFEERRGLVIGVLSAANATGQLVFLPLLATTVVASGWRSASTLVAIAAAIMSLLAFLFLRDRPEDLGLKPYGWTHATVAPTAPPKSPLAALAWASKQKAFWVLAGSFFVCGASTNGLVGTHLIPACHDSGIAEVQAAGLLAMMGIFDILGTSASGWLTDRYSGRYLLFAYYALRGISLLFLPATLAQGGTALAWFAIFYGLDWIATVPPTVRLTSDYFGRENVGVVYGWIGASHQLGASLAAFGAGAIRTGLGKYDLAFWLSGGVCFAVAFVFLWPRAWSTQRSAVR
ncbi:MFS transporter [Bryobacter aggregatus]|uniref:MFS transporter n=1 Tax=Bryobacter aggregatus TaxID=360054 RepID=UPI000ADB907F|nr:MFS transporter [Bryobacter aggregatus]